jgi:hypothetical protein
MVSITCKNSAGPAAPADVTGQGSGSAVQRFAGLSAHCATQCGGRFHRDKWRPSQPRQGLVSRCARRAQSWTAARPGRIKATSSNADTPMVRQNSSPSNFKIETGLVGAGQGGLGLIKVERD